MTKNTIFYIFNPSANNPIGERSVLAGALRRAVSASTCYGASDLGSARQYLNSDAPRPTAFILNTIALRDSFDVESAVALLQRHTEKAPRDTAKPLVFLLARQGAYDAATRISKETGHDVHVLNPETLKTLVAQSKVRSAAGLRKFCTHYTNDGHSPSVPQGFDI